MTLKLTVVYDTGRKGQEFINKLDGIVDEEDGEAVWFRPSRELINQIIEEFYNGDLIFEVNLDRF